jgi:hypothetical protein
VSLKIPSLTVEPGDPFKHDVLKRKQTAGVLTKIIGDLSHPFVLAINSPFGTGKTTFIKMWQAALHKDGFKILHFNAWENVVMVISGFLVLCGLGAVAILIPAPTHFQTFVFRTMLAVGAAGFSRMIPGYFKIESRSALHLFRAGGAVAFFY